MCTAVVTSGAWEVGAATSLPFRHSWTLQGLRELLKIVYVHSNHIPSD